MQLVAFSPGTVTLTLRPEETPAFDLTVSSGPAITLSTENRQLVLEVGSPGPAASVTVGTTTTLSPGSSATVTNAGTSLAAILNFGIPQGIQGVQGPAGPAGSSGIVYATAPLAYNAVTKTISIDLSAYETVDHAAETYYPVTNPAGYLTTADLSDYATQSWVTSRGYLTDAPSNGYGYTRKNGAWSYTPKFYSMQVGEWTNITSGQYLVNDGSFVTNITAGDIILSDIAGLGMHINNVGLTFPDATTQTTAGISPATAASTYFPIPTGTAAQYIAGDGSLITFPTLSSADKLTAVVSNQTGATLTAGTVVYINGTHGNLPTVTKAQANSEATSSGTYGLVQADIANNGSGNIVLAGVIENLSLNAYADGDKLYLSPTVAGAFTTTKPSAPNHMVFIGVVTRAHPTLGKIQLRIANGFELEELHNVAISSVANLDLLAYESSTSLWKNKSFGTLGLLTVSAAASTYQTIAGMSSYLTTSAAASTYYPQTNPAGYITSAALSGYALLYGTSAFSVTGASIKSFDGSDNFAALDQGVLNFGTGSTLSGIVINGSSITFADSTVQTTAAVAGVPEAPIDGTTYGRLNGAWTAVGGGSVLWGGISGTLSDQTDLYSALSAKYDASNPSGFITSSALTGYATQSWVTSQGYLTSSALTPYLLSSTAASTYSPKASPTFTGTVTIPTPLTSDNSTTAASTAFVKAQGYLTSAPVTSVAGRTGAVTLAVADVSGAAPTASPTLTGTPLSTTAAADTNTTQIATTAFVVGQASSTTPAATGTAAVGTSLKYARADHVHANPLPTGGTTGQVLAKIDGTNYNVQWTTAGSGSGAPVIDIQTFGSATTSGSFTWTKPTGAKWVRVICFSGGGGGGSGARHATTSARGGGSGGAAGPYVLAEFDAATLPSTVAVTVGAGGSGAGGQVVDSTNGNTGGNGGVSSFGTYLATVNASSGNSGGTTVNGSPSPTYTNYSTIGGNAVGATSAGAAGNISAGTTGGAVTLIQLSATGGGGAAGQAANTTTQTNGGSGGYRSSAIIGSTTLALGGTGTGGTAPWDGLAGTFLGWGGMGGGGGGYRTGVVGQAGGAGGWPGGGGGGGSASDNGFVSGAGGKGANGAVFVITFF